MSNLVERLIDSVDKARQASGLVALTDGERKTLREYYGRESADDVQRRVDAMEEENALPRCAHCGQKVYGRAP